MVLKETKRTGFCGVFLLGRKFLHLEKEYETAVYDTKSYLYFCRMADRYIPLQEYRTAYELYEVGSSEVTYFFGENNGAGAELRFRQIGRLRGNRRKCMRYCRTRLSV